MKRISLLTFIICSTILSAQNTNELTSYFENDKIKIEYKYQDCVHIGGFDSEYVLFKITNKTDNEINISWKEQVWYNEICSNCEHESPESRKKIIVLSNTIYSTDCNNLKNISIFSKFTEKLENMPGVNTIIPLTKFELNNLTITTNEN
jgi:hypothetical protein